MPGQAIITLECQKLIRTGDMDDIVANILKAALLECCSPDFVENAIRHRYFALAVSLAEADLDAFARKDPASHGSHWLIARGYSSYRAVAHYRLANALLMMNDLADAHDIETYAFLISHRGKLTSGAELHPRAMIGARFVRDHGWGTVIGETSVIGNDCYVLGGVTPGATGIAGNARGKRHPTLGNRVQVGAFARIFGDVHIGDDTFVGPHCVISHDVENGSIVTVTTRLQILRARRRSFGAARS